MNRYVYRALNEVGEEVQGTLMCASQEEAYAKLRPQFAVLLDVIEKKAWGGALVVHLGSWGKEFGSAELGVWIQQLSELIGAGFTLEAALRVFLEEEGLSVRQKGLVGALLESIKGGSSFSGALSQHPKIFPNAMVALVYAGEQSGRLPFVLEQIAQELSATQELKNKLISALAYPMIVSVLSVLMVAFLLSYVVPQITGVLEKNAQNIPWITQLMLWLSVGINRYGVYGVVGVFGGIVAANYALKNPKRRFEADRFCVQIPLIGAFLIQYNILRLAGTLGLMISSGVPIVKALPHAAASMGNVYLRQQVLDCVKKIEEGSSLSQALQRVEEFPALLLSFIRMGEHSGNVGKMLQNSAAQMKETLLRKLQRLVSIAEPLIIVLMGFIVMVIVLSVLLPIIQMNTIAL